MTSKYTKSAKGQECQIRIPGVCNYDTETTVFAHLNGAGWAMKKPDIHGAYACSDCHSTVDGVWTQNKVRYDSEAVKLMFYEGMERTQALMIKNGILVL